MSTCCFKKSINFKVNQHDVPCDMSIFFEYYVDKIEGIISFWIVICLGTVMESYIFPVFLRLNNKSAIVCVMLLLD